MKTVIFSFGLRITKKITEAVTMKKDEPKKSDKEMTTTDLDKVTGGLIDPSSIIEEAKDFAKKFKK